MKEPRNRLGLTLEVHSDEEAAHGLFLSRVLEDGLSEVRSEDWATAAKALPELGDPIFRAMAEGRGSAVVQLGEALVYVSVGHGRAYAVAAARSIEPIEAALAEMRASLPTPDPTSTHEVTVNFWTYGPQGAQMASRSISVPGWGEIEHNYAERTRAALEPLMQSFEPARGGQLILWHGLAGTGKTFALRALAWEWRDWCEFHYIVDPDTFFGDRADYLMGVLLQPQYMDFYGVPGVSMAELALGPGEEDEDGEPKEKPWRLLMLEDTGELLAADAKERTGQGLSRFLNVVDGLIGQGLRVLVLVTTNEELKRLHPAVARPGRCAANVDFRPLAAVEAAAWLARYGIDEDVDRSTLLAALFARAEERETGPSPAPAGFVG